MVSDSPYWYKLILHWVKVLGREGLTIPFIIGAKSLVSIGNEVTKKSISDLFSEIKNSDIKNTITLSYCDTIGEYVLGINNPNSPKVGSNIKNQNTGKTTLITTTGIEVLGKSLDEISDSLVERYLLCLQQGEYSKIDLKWAKYSDSEIKMIKTILES